MPDLEIIQLRNRILGILIHQARERARRSRKECATALGTSTGRFAAYEEGEKPISLPELELLARYLECPLRDFRKNEVPTQDAIAHLPDPTLFLPLGHRLVGARLRQARLERDLQQQDLADLLGCSAAAISAYEYGERPMPMAELEVVARALGVTLDFFMDSQNEVGAWHRLQEEFERFRELPAEMREFVLRPINRSYLDLAIKLSQMPAGSLRQIAEGLLEITY